MTQFRRVTDSFEVSSQITPDEARQAAAAGVTLIINNRPDGEQPGQPTNAEIEAAARAGGADYLYLPVVGPPTPDRARAQAAPSAAPHGRRPPLAPAPNGPVLAFCRSGTRSITTWALGEAAAGHDKAELAKLAADAGYD